MKNEVDTAVMADIVENEVTFYTDKENPYKVYAEFPMRNGAKAFEPIHSKLLKAFLGRQYRMETGEQVVADFSEILEINEQDAMYEQKNAVKIERRVAGSLTKKKVVYFLADAKWTTILISHKGWRVGPVKGVRFLKNVLDSEQIEPDPNGGDLLGLMRKYISNLSEEDFLLLVIYIVQGFSRGCSHFVAILSSDKGTGKTTLAKLMRGLLDPSAAGAAVMPSAESDLKTLLGNSYVVCFDNTAALTTKVSNLLCAAITGAKEAKRKLYTDCDQIVLNLHNLVIMNGIDIVPYKSDLAERSLLFELQTIDKKRRRTDQEFWDSFEKDKARILGAIFDTLVKAMNNIAAIEDKGLHRMADANKEMIAVALALGISQERFQNILDENKKKLQAAYSQMNPFVDFVLSYMRNRPNINMAAEALYKDMRENIVGNGRFFPDSPSALSRKLNQERDALSDAGYEFSKGAKGKSNNYLVIRRIPNSQLTKAQVESMARRRELLGNASDEE